MSHDTDWQIVYDVARNLIGSVRDYCYKLAMTDPPGLYRIAGLRRI